MGGWEYVFLAYGIVWGAILVYLLSLKGRLRKAESELAQSPAMEDIQEHAEN